MPHPHQRNRRGRRLPCYGQARQEIIAGPVLLGQHAVIASAVITDAGGLDDHLGFDLSRLDRLHDRLPCVEPATADKLLALRCPTGGDETAPRQILTGQVDDSERAIG